MFKYVIVPAWVSKIVHEKNLPISVCGDIDTLATYLSTKDVEIYLTINRYAKTYLEDLVSDFKNHLNTVIDSKRYNSNVIDVVNAIAACKDRLDSNQTPASVRRTNYVVTLGTDGVLYFVGEAKSEIDTAMMAERILDALSKAVSVEQLKQLTLWDTYTRSIID